MSIISRSFHVISKQIAYLGIIVTTLIALIVASVYWLSNAVEQRQDEIESWVSEYIGYPVTISSAKIDWAGLEPKLQVNDITIFQQNGQTSLLTLQQLFIGLDLIASLNKTEPVIKDVSLSGLTLSIIRNAQGEIAVQGWTSNSNASSINENWLRWAQRVSKLEFDNITLSVSDYKQPLLSGHYLLQHAEFEHEDSQWLTVLSLALPAEVGQHVQVSAEMALNNLFQIGTWQAQTEFINLKLAAFSDILRWQDAELSNGLVSSSLEMKGDGKELEFVSSSVNASDVQLTSLSELKETTTIEKFIGQLDWSTSSDQWQLSGSNLLIGMNGAEWLPTSFKLVKDSENKLTFNSDYLRLSDLTSIAAISNFTPEFIRQQKPAGDFDNLTIVYSPEQGVTSLAFKLREGGLLPWQDRPGVTGLTASVNWSDGVGDINFDSHQIILYPETWLDEAVYFDSITGVVKLQSHIDKWSIQSQKLRLWNDDLNIQVDGSVERDSSGKIVNDLVIGLQDLDVASWKSYVPQGILEPDFKEWSNEAFVAGKVTEGTIKLAGDLADFPYDDAPEKGAFTMALKVEGTQLHYAPEWPDIVDVYGDITSEGSTLVIASKQGKIAGFDFRDVTTTIKRFVLSDPILTVEGDMAGTTQQALDFLKNSPLKQRFGSVANTVVASGQSDIHLELMVPLTHADDTQASGDVTFNQSRMQSMDIPELSLTDVNGKLKFSNNGVFADKITAQFLDDEVLINVSPESDKTTVVAKGQSSIDKLKSLTQENVPDFVTGQFNYQLDVSIAEKTLGDFYIDAVGHSDLQGVSLDLPQPYGKSTEQTKTLRAGFEHVGEDLVYTLNYENLINMVAMPKNENWRGEIRLGASGPVDLPVNGIKVRGQLEHVSIEEWLDWQASQSKSGSNDFIDDIDDISMNIVNLTGFDQTLSKVNLSMQRDAQGWRTQFNSEQTKGTLYIPHSFENKAMLKVDIDQANLTFPKKTDTKSEVVENKSSSLWPSMAINIGSLTVDNMHLGQLSLRGKRTQNAWTIEDGMLSSDYFTAYVTSGVWQKLSTGDITRISLQSTSDDLAGLLKSLGYIQAVDATGIKIGLDFSWPDDPLSVSAASIEGKLDLKVGRGELTDIEPGAAGRIFGLLSIAAIPRRLALDFSDLFGKGFNFNSILGTFNLKNGLASTSNMAMKAESALIEMKGPIDIVNKTYNQQVKVTPNVSSTLPLAGAMAGGPVGLGVGTAILIFDKLADNLFDQNIVNVISYKYDLTGSWDDPQLNVVNPTVQ